MRTEELDFKAIRSDRGALVQALESAGAQLKGDACRCPFHDDRSASAGIYADDAGEWRFACHAGGCGVAGDLLDIRAKLNGTDRADEVRRMSAGQVPTPKPAQNTQEPQRPTYPSVEALKAAAERSDRERGGQLRNLYLYRDAAGAEVLAVLRIERPDGTKTFKQAARVDGGYRMQAPAGPLPLFGLARIKPAEVVIVAEGEKAASALQRQGYAATTSAMGAGKASKTDWSPLGGKTVYLWPDNDAPDPKTAKRTGLEHMREVRAILEALPSPPADIRWINPDRLALPVKGDAVDFIEEHGAYAGEALAEVLAQAEATGPLADLHADLQAAIRGERYAVPLPWQMLSTLARALLPGTVTIWCGSPGATKSLCLLQSYAFQIRLGFRVAILELEDGRSYHLRRLLAQLAENSELTCDEWCRVHPDEVAQAEHAHRADMLALQSGIDALPDAASPTPDTFLNWLQRKADAGCRVMAIDPVSLMVKGRNPWEADEKFLFGAKRIVERAGASLLLVTHPRRLPHGAKHATMTGDDLAGGAAYYRFAQTILSLRAHDPQAGEIETTAGRCRDTWNRTVSVFKARNGRGIEGARFACQFDGKSLTLRECGKITNEDKR